MGARPNWVQKTRPKDPKDRSTPSPVPTTETNPQVSEVTDIEAGLVIRLGYRKRGWYPSCGSWQAVLAGFWVVLAVVAGCGFQGWGKPAGHRGGLDPARWRGEDRGTARWAGPHLAVPGRRFGLVFRLFWLWWRAVDSRIAVNLLVTEVGPAAGLGLVGIEVPQEGLVL